MNCGGSWFWFCSLPEPAWYTEKYRRDEGDLDGYLEKNFVGNVREARSKMPQVAAAIRGQSTNLDGYMNQSVWGGKARLENGGSGVNHDNDPGNNNGTEAGFSVVDGNEDAIGISGSSNPGDDEKPIRKRRKRRRKKQGTTHEKSEGERRKEELLVLEQNQKKLVLQSSIAGIAVGAVAVAAVSVLLGGGGGGRK